MNKNLVIAASFGLANLVFCVSAAAELKPFYEELADEWHCGYKNDMGEIVVPMKKYDECGEFSDGLAYIGMVAKPIIGSESDGDKYLQGFIDQTGFLVIPIEHEVVEGVYPEYKDFSEGLVVVYRNGKYGYMNKQRELVIPYRYQYAGEFKDGLALVSQYDKNGIIDRSGNTVIPIKFHSLTNYSEGLAVYSEKNHWNDEYSYGYLDKKGNVSIKAKWNEASIFSEGLAAVRVGDDETGKWGIIDKTGNFIVKPEYDEPNIQIYTDAFSIDDGYYKKGRINMYKYTDASDPYKSSITQYTLDRQGNIIKKKFYSNWDSIVDDFVEDNDL